MKANLIPRSDSAINNRASSSDALGSSFEGSREPDAPPWITELSEGGGVKQSFFSLRKSKPGVPAKPADG